LLAVSGLAFFAGLSASGASPPPFLASLRHNSLVGSTVPANGDVNPYGVAVVQSTNGKLTKGDVLISNFNAKSNLQGTGTTIVEMSPDGKRSVFSELRSSSLPGQCPGGVGLTTALVALPGGWVVVGSLPTTNGMAATARAGCLIVLNSNGVAKETISGKPINGPWDMTAVATSGGADVFVTNVLNGTVAAKGKVVHLGTVVRVDLKWDTVHPADPPSVASEKVIANGLPERTDPAALVVGPTGDAIADNGTLYVADTLDNAVVAVANAAGRTSAVDRGTLVSTDKELDSPLGLTLAPDGDVLVANGGDGDVVEVSPSGSQVAETEATTAGAGALFGLGVSLGGKSLYFVNDAANSLRLLS
jgi:hypothetical protein